jgi:hypothetical protein
MERKILSVLDHIDSEIRMNRDELLSLGSQASVGSENMYHALYSKLVRIEKNMYIEDLKVIYEVCKVFFNGDQNISFMNNPDGSRCINVETTVYGKYKEYTKCEIDPYHIGTVPNGSREPPAVRNASVSFLMGSKWNNEFFESSFDLVKLLCVFFLPDSSDKAQLLSALDLAYTDVALEEERLRKADQETRENEQIQLEGSFTNEVKRLPEFTPFVNAVNILIANKFKGKLFKYQILGLLNNAFERVIQT